MALMAKLRWDLHTNNSKAWVTFFMHKYKNHFSRTNFNINSDILPRPNFSFVFKSIFKDENIFNFNISHIVSNGTNISLWNDNWIHISSLRKLLISPIPLVDLSKTISTIISYSEESLSWNLASIPFPIPDHIASMIKNISLPLPSSDQKDSIFWKLTPNGIFTLKLACKSLTYTIDQPNLS